MDIGVIGVGRIGAFHAATLASLPSVDRVVINDVDAERAASLAAERGYEEASSVDDLLGKVGAVVITSSTDTHAELIHASVDAGLPTFCEKPISLDLESTRSVVEHVRRSRSTLQMGFQRRFDPGFRAASELVLGGGLGNLYLVRMAGHDPAPPHESYIPVSGGIFRDFSVHDFDALRFVTGREGGGGVRRRLGHRIPGVRLVRRRGHGGGNGAPPRWGTRRALGQPTRPAWLRHPDGVDRIRGQRLRSVGTSGCHCARSSRGCHRHPQRHGRISNSVSSPPTELSLLLSRGGRGAAAEPVHAGRRPRGTPCGRGLRSVAGRAPPGTARGGLLTGRVVTPVETPT